MQKELSTYNWFECWSRRAVVVGKLLEQDNPDLGYDEAKGECVDMVKTGIYQSSSNNFHWVDDVCLANKHTKKRIGSILLKRGWNLGNLNALRIELDESNVTRMLNDLFNESSDAGLAFFFFIWFCRRNGLRHGIRAVCTMIHISISGDMNNLAMDFLCDIVKNVDGRKDWHDFIFEVLRETSRDPRVLEIAYSMLVSCYVKRNMIDMAIKLVSNMKNINFFPSTGVCISLLSALLELKQFESADELLRDMESRGDGVNESKSLFIREFCACGYFGSACDLLLDMQKHHGVVDIVAYTIVINALFKRGIVKEAAALLCKLIHTGTKPDSVLLASVVDGYCKAGRLTEALCLLNSSGCAHDVLMYNSIISMLCSRGKMLEANQLFNKMFESGICPDSFNYSTIIGGYCKASQMDQALKIFAEMLKRGTKRAVLTYTVLIEGYCNIDDLQGAENMFSAIEREGLQPDVVTYNVLMNGYNRKGNIPRIYEKMSIMIKNGISPDHATHNILMHGLVKRGFLMESRERFNRRGFSPDKIAFTNIIASYSKERNVEEACCKWCNMDKDDLKPDVVTCSALLNGYCRTDRMQEAKVLFKNMLGSWA